MAQAANTPLTILSPYITGDLLSSLVTGKSGARIYTWFDTALFASGASDFEVIASLVQAGHQVFKVESLHAKVVMDEDSFVTVGSQNLTERGRRLNKELSVSLSGDSARELARMFHKNGSLLKL